MNIQACIACDCRESIPPESTSPAVSVSIGTRKFVQPAYRVRCCAKCGLFYKTVVLSEQELADYYEMVDFRVWETPGYFPTERAALKYLRELPHGSRLLDFGCSTGRLLAGLTNDYQCHGFEINADAAQIAAGKGLRMWQASELAAAAGVFDAVIASDVFEHLTKPIEVLRRLCRTLRENGNLILITGNADARLCRRNPALFWYFRNPEHVCMLTHRHAHFLEKTLGLRLKIWKELCHYDVGFPQIIRAYAEYYAYWGSRPEASPWLRGFVNLVPVIRRASHWTTPPTQTSTRDHVVAVFEKG